MNGKRARALRKVAAQVAFGELEVDPVEHVIPAVRYTWQEHRNSSGTRQRSSLRLGPCVRKIEKEAKREYNNLTR